MSCKDCDREFCDRNTSLQDEVECNRIAIQRLRADLGELRMCRPAALAAVAYLGAHAALAAAGVSEDRPAAARRLADAWIALKRACAEIPAGGPEPIRQPDPWKLLLDARRFIDEVHVSLPFGTMRLWAIRLLRDTPSERPAAGPGQDLGAAATRPAAEGIYPPGWPKCACGDYCLDGKATCGRVECLR